MDDDFKIYWEAFIEKMLKGKKRRENEGEKIKEKKNGWRKKG